MAKTEKSSPSTKRKMLQFVNTQRDMPVKREADVRNEDYLEIYGDYIGEKAQDCLLYTSPSPRDGLLSRMPSSA